jgi:hypothetical protein
MSSIMSPQMKKSTHMSKEAFSYTTPMWRIPLNMALQILQECGLKLQKILQVAKDGSNLLG